MAVQTCSLPGCSNSRAGPDRLACGEMHHLLLMAGRYNPSLPHPHQPILDRNVLGLCALPSCSRSPSQAYPWCSRTHYLSWLFDFYAHLSPQQICKLPDCTRHVHVHDGGLPSEFCGWRHRQKFEMQNALQVRQRQQPLHTQQGDHAHVPSVESALHAFKQFVCNGVISKSINVDDNFFDKHPWEVLVAKGETCYVIARSKFTMKSKKKQRIWATKDHYHWKQHGRPEKKGGYTMRYLGYKVLKGKKEESAQHYEENADTMKEYTMKHYSSEDCEPYCLLELCVKRRKGEADIEVLQQLDDSSPVDVDTVKQYNMEDCESFCLVDNNCVNQRMGEIDNVLPQLDDRDCQLLEQHPPVDDNTLEQDSVEDRELCCFVGRRKGVKRCKGAVDIHLLSQRDDLCQLLEALPPPPLDYDIFNGLPPVKDSSLDYIFNGQPPDYDVFIGQPPIEDSSEDSLSY